MIPIKEKHLKYFGQIDILLKFIPLIPQNLWEI